MLFFVLFREFQKTLFPGFHTFEKKTSLERLAIVFSFCLGCLFPAFSVVAGCQKRFESKRLAPNEKSEISEEKFVFTSGEELFFSKCEIDLKWHTTRLLCTKKGGLWSNFKGTSKGTQKYSEFLAAIGFRNRPSVELMIFFHFCTFPASLTPAY